MKRALITSFLLLALALVGCADEPDVAADADEDIAVDVVNDFDTLDLSGDSYLDADEVAEWVDDSGTFETWDADADSELDADEIAGNAFELWDADGNGVVSNEEWKEGTEFWFPEQSNVTVFSDWDGDADSELDADEFSEAWDISYLGEAWTTQPFGKEAFKESYFSLYDADGDEKVSDEEWLQGAAAFGIADDIQ